MAQDKKIEDLKKKIEELESQIKQTKRGVKPSTMAKSAKKFTSKKDLFTWKAPARVFVKHDRAWYLKIATIALVFILIFAYLGDFVVIFVVCTIVLIAFLLGSVPPDDVTHKITNKGIETFDKLYKWEELEEFWIADKSKKRLIHVRTNLNFPPRLLMLIDKKSENKVVKILGTHLDYKEFDGKQGWVSKLTDGVTIDPKYYEKLFKAKKTRSSRKKRTKRK
jgi:hypothetical protein